MVHVFEWAVSRIHRLLSALALLSGCAAAVAQTTALPVALTADQVMARVEAMNQLRAQRLVGYSSLRTYHLEVHGLFSREAEMVVRADYRAPNSKVFTVISESGSGAVRKRVFRRLLQAELDSMDPQSQRHTALTAENYRFQLVDHYGTGSDEFYVLKVEPKTKDRFLIAGKIWVDAADFAVTKVDGQPAVNPSWWTKSTDFNRIYRHIGEFWLPESNHSVTKVRIFGTAVLTITYRDYRISPASAAAAAPDSSVKMPLTTSPSVIIPDTVTVPHETSPGDANSPIGRAEHANAAPADRFRGKGLELLDAGRRGTLAVGSDSDYELSSFSTLSTGISSPMPRLQAGFTDI